MPLSWMPQVHLRCDAYEAWVAPHAGGRLARLLWRGPSGSRDLVIPASGEAVFEPDAWPKQGAFPMLPYANRLAGARFHWEGKERKVRPVPGQVHGVHGLGHRQHWHVESRSSTRVSLHMQHQADEVEWPWSFTAQLDYEVSERGLKATLSVLNDSSDDMPAILGWHPYVPAYWLSANDASGIGSCFHDLGADGLNYPDSPLERVQPHRISVDLETPHTQALANWSSPWEFRSLNGEIWRLESDAKHLVHHVPADRSYACAEPVTAPPGSLSRCDSLEAQTAIALKPGEKCQLTCVLEVADSSD